MVVASGIATTGRAPERADDVRVISLVALAHGCSHFFQLVLPPLFPFIAREFSVTYTELGAMMTVFFVTSGIGQPIAGFLVDRLGAKRVLIGGLALYAVAIFSLGFAGSIWLMLPALALAALGNCVFHPADFTVLNACVEPTRLGRAFGIHTLGGNLGWALAPVTMLGLEAYFGWRGAVMGAGSIGFAVLALLLVNRRMLRDDGEGGEARAMGRAPAAPLGVAMLFNPPVLLCFAYFVLIAAALIGVQNFLPPTLEALHAIPLTLGATVLTGFLLGASAGVLAGGFIADRWRRHGTVIALGLAGAALLFALVGAAALPPPLLIGAVAGAGFLSGVTTPSRDLLVRSATPKGATGRVFGFVYSGLDVGSAFAPVTIGYLLDTGEPAMVLWLVSAIFAVAILTAIAIRPGAATTAPAG